MPGQGSHNWVLGNGIMGKPAFEECSSCGKFRELTKKRKEFLQEKVKH